MKQLSLMGKLSVRVLELWRIPDGERRAIQDQRMYNARAREHSDLSGYCDPAQKEGAWHVIASAS